MNSSLTEKAGPNNDGSRRPDDDSEYFSGPRPGLHLYFYGGSHDGTSVEIGGPGEYLFGRAKESHFRFSDLDRTDLNVSRRHALLRVRTDGVVLINQIPKNGLILNGVLLADRQEVPLNDTDIVTLGGKGPNIRVRIGDLTALRQGDDGDGDE